MINVVQQDTFRLAVFGRNTAPLPFALLPFEEGTTIDFCFVQAGARRLRNNQVPALL